MKIPIIFVISLIFITGCTSFDLATPKNNVDSLLSDNTCDKPCVLGISPGVTTQSEAWTIVEDSTLLSNCEQQYIGIQDGMQWWIDCNSKSFDVVAFDSNMVSWIVITPPNLSMKQLMQKYGPPDSLGLMYGPLPDEPVTLKAILVYDKIQAEVALNEESGREYKITSDTHVEAITFKNKQEQAKTIANFSNAWKGYGTYSR